MKFGNVHCFQAIFSMVQAIKNRTSFYENHLNGYHFLDLNVLILNINLFFQSDLSLGK